MPSSMCKYEVSGIAHFPKLGKRGEGDSRRSRCESRYEEEKVSALDLLGS